jgi:periplasmic protein TonB
VGRIDEAFPVRLIGVGLCVVTAHIFILIFFASHLIWTTQPIEANEIQVALLPLTPAAPVQPQTLDRPRRSNMTPAVQKAVQPPPPLSESTLTESPQPLNAAPQSAQTPAQKGQKDLSHPALETVQHIGCTFPPPIYPVLSRRRKETGSVLISLVVNVQGEVESAAIKQSSGFDRLDQVARHAVQQGICRPYIKNGRPIRARADVPFQFSLEES